ncbi:MAG TPA: SDR family NAD(P)-dependent oxidoreductase [Bradyrhizobium sp.]|uniref:SDR family NAD(P)-dependent oxidoreductase n=1 Tax=Bradyrhizobium sp. TaxID=376 RepID=UPI002C89E328|nr:SDR family NAD(P)-dependent oxidoreductase [Bradyrhizobium sp.]HLZ00761.1 SDR family NAD(P)-dependent oxidoreductase [Bradyrhizobium sp.]
MDLKGAVALVTGGNGGLGQRICHALAQEGAHVAVMYARSRVGRIGAEGVIRHFAMRTADHDPPTDWQGREVRSEAAATSRICPQVAE